MSKKTTVDDLVTIKVGLEVRINRTLDSLQRKLDRIDALEFDAEDFYSKYATEAASLRSQICDLDSFVSKLKEANREMTLIISDEHNRGFGP